LTWNLPQCRVEDITRAQSKKLVIICAMKFLRHHSEVEMLGGSGMLRVNITPALSSVVYLEAMALAGILLVGWRSMAADFREHPIRYSFYLLGLLSTLWYQIAGSEEIEFDAQRVMIRKNRPWWRQTREYPMETCNGLEVLDTDDRNRFSFKAAGITVSFGRDLSASQADEILDELQRVLPDVSHRLLAGNDVFSRHFTLLKLS
jgi:hypothetical protein